MDDPAMTAAGNSGQPRSVRRRRLRRGIAVGAVFAVAWLAGRGTMLVGREPASVAGGDVAKGERLATTSNSPLPDAAPAAELSSVVASTPAPTAPPLGEPTAAGAAPTVPLAAAAATSGPTVDADRFAALTSALAVHIERAEFAAAGAALAHVRNLPLAAAQRTEVDRMERTLLTAARDRLEAVEADLASGRGRAAAAAFAPFAAVRASGGAWLDEAMATTGWSAWRSGTIAPDVALPSPRPLARGRAVTAHGADGVVRGMVVAGDATECTLRVDHASGVAFPTVALVVCEPEGPSGDEAIDLALAAARQGDGVLARAWALVAARRGGERSLRWPRLLAALP
jgi:hypothetical protein